MIETRKGAIIGAGIGGLTAAVALKQRGIAIDIYDASPDMTAFPRSNTGIIVPPNAMAVLKKLGLAKAVAEAGFEVDWLTILDHKAQVLSKSKAAYSYKKGSAPTIAIRRNKLRKILLDELTPEQIHTEHRCLALDEHSDGICAHFESQDSQQFDYVIGADGLHSQVRAHFFPEQRLQITSQVCWRGVVETKLPRPWRNQLTELWGMGLRFGFVQVSKKYAYWYAIKSAITTDELDVTSDDLNLIELFQEFPDIVCQLIALTPPTDIHSASIGELPPLALWHGKHGALLGDAAHASIPNLGQGGALAMEDAWVLAKKLAKYPQPELAFQQYQLSRRKRVERVVKLSQTLGSVSHFESPLACVLRNVFMTSVPGFVTRHQQKQLYDCGDLE
ncbi:NAD(P)-binding protein [Vibrio sp. SM6]|uniref:NAD(P)-binding protein n=1 Tax=Vibrio agarilyticus TaxID=2726741 RepID=A0A7X8TQS1_9VIBR|nr:FAD-dependent monooxygenase [Vibrio agarilyticus]NLS13035.1 NAD(P)-binding protein [Vibrio agarilyticus]